MNAPQQLTVDDASAGLRLDKFLSMALPDISRARLQGMIEEGAVLRLHGNGPCVAEGEPRSAGGAEAMPPTVFKNSSYKVKLGETYTLTIPELVTLDLTPATGITLDIVYEDDDSSSSISQQA